VILNLICFFIICLFAIPSFASETACSNRCGGDSPVKIDLQNQCMCVGTQCFKVGIGGNLSSEGARGRFNPMRTNNGTGVLGVARGTKYSTTAGAGSTVYDRDALSTSTPNDTDGGKWIHKAGNCSSTWRTKGCVAVPCDYWPLVKSQMGKAVTYCGGKGPNLVYNSSGSKTVNQSGMHRRYDTNFNGQNVVTTTNDDDSSNGQKIVTYEDNFFVRFMNWMRGMYTNSNSNSNNSNGTK
jgi:hypothetical protein